MLKTSRNANENAYNMRANKLFQQHQLSIYKQADRVFAILMPMQWLAGILTACVISPLTWNGVQSRIHIHVWTAIILGGIITILPMALVFLRPGTVVTRNIVAISQMLMTGLLIHLSGGRIETHFHVFGSLAFLAFYRDWRVLIPATLVTTLDHLVRGWFYPLSLYGALTGNEWRWVEHAIWVIFIDIFLIAACRRSTKEIWDIARRTAELDASEERYRAVVEQTKEGMVLLEPETLRVLECNEAFSRLLGCASIEEAKKLSSHDYCTVAPAEVIAISQMTAEQKSVTNIEHIYYRCDGSLITVAVSASLINYDDSQAYCFLVRDITDHKLAEAELQRLALVAQKTQNAVMISDPEGYIQWVNEGFTRLTGYEASEVMGKKPGQLLQGEKTNPATVAAMRAACHARQPFDGEIYNYRKDGRGYWVSISLTPINGKQGQLQGFIAIEMDITERKRVEEAIKESERRFREVAEALPQFIWTCTADGLCDYLSPQWIKYTGVPAREQLGFGWSAQLHPDDREQAQKAWLQAATSKGIFDIEFRIRRHDGVYRWFRTRAVPTYDETGHLRQWFGSNTDIDDLKQMQEQMRQLNAELEKRVALRTEALSQANKAMRLEVVERQRAESELHAAQQFLHKVINNVPNHIFVKDADSHFILANNEVAKFYGTTIEQLIGKTDADFNAKADEVERIRRDDLEVLHTLQEKFIAEDKLTGADGDIRWLQTIKRPFALDASGVQYLLGVATDLTERKALENQLRHAQKMESIGQLAAGIAHEINTPTQYVGDNTRFVREAFGELTTVLGQFNKMLVSARSGNMQPELIAQVENEIETADMEYLLEEIPKALQQSLEGVTRIAKIVQAMKEFAHPGSNEKKAANLNRAIESTITVARNEWKYVAEMETSFDESLPPVPCLLGEFNQVILNMTINASHAIAEVIGDGANGKGKITITTANIANEWAEIRICDTGSGIPPQARNRIFDPFFTTKEVGKGTGQGLAISHNVIVEKHKGQLSFETEVGRGTTFIIRLPLTDSASANN